MWYNSCTVYRNVEGPALIETARKATARGGPADRMGRNEVSRYREPIAVRSPLRIWDFQSDSHVCVGSRFSCVPFPIRGVFPLLFKSQFKSKRFRASNSSACSTLWERWPIYFKGIYRETTALLYLRRPISV